MKKEKVVWGESFNGTNMKKVTLKVNGNLYIMNNLPSNFAEQGGDGMSFAPGLNWISEKICVNEIILDKDKEFQGDVYVQNIIIPEGITPLLLAAGELGSGYNYM